MGHLILDPVALGDFYADNELAPLLLALIGFIGLVSVVPHPPVRLGDEYNREWSSNRGMRWSRGGYFPLTNHTQPTPTPPRARLLPPPPPAPLPP